MEAFQSLIHPFEVDDESKLCPIACGAAASDEVTQEVLSAEEIVQNYKTKLYFFEDSVENVLNVLSKQIDAVYVNEDYTPFSRKRDEQMKQTTKSLGIEFNSDEDLLLLPVETILSNSAKPYTVSKSENAVKKVMEAFQSLIHPFEVDDESKLCPIACGAAASDEVTQEVLSAEEIGTSPPPAVYVLNPEQIRNSNDYRSNNCVQFMIECLIDLNKSLKEKGTKLYFFEDSVENVLNVLSKQIDAVYVNEDYTPFSRKRDEQMKQTTKSLGIEFNSDEDLLLLPVETILSNSAKPYTVFTHFKNKMVKDIGNLFFNEVTQEVLSAEEIGNKAKERQSRHHRTL
ncbi:Deoxyribodipyrimidine photo-lyase [Nymphon striatum]|nr:Deoxyribodipyrimidine photo-lyase [Nymphon striatum]